MYTSGNHRIFFTFCNCVVEVSHHGLCNGACSFGGGISNLGTLTVTNSSISDTFADTGGGIYNSSGNPSLNMVTISNNTAAYGGGMYNASGNPSLSTVTISNNTADSDGGRIYNEWGEPVLTNVTISGNSADDGGALYAIGFGSTLTNVTISNNTAIRGGAIYFDSVQMISLFNTIIGDNTLPQCSGTLIALTHSHNQVQDTNFGMTNSDGGGNIVGFDPNLGPLANNGGFTQIHALLLGSLANDAGADFYCPAVDLRGVTRPQGIHCDIGAYERFFYKLFLALIVR